MASEISPDSYHKSKKVADQAKLLGFGWQRGGPPLYKTFNSIINDLKETLKNTFSSSRISD